MGNHGAGARSMTQPFVGEQTGPTVPHLPPVLVEHADRLLLGTGLDCAAALLIASGQVDPPPELSGLANVLRAGWQGAEDPA